MSMWHEERLLIDGKLVEAEGGATYENINPANEEVIGVAADASRPMSSGRSPRRAGRSTRPTGPATSSSASGASASCTRRCSTTRTSSPTSPSPRSARRAC